MLPVYAFLPIGLGLGVIAATSSGKKPASPAQVLSAAHPRDSLATPDSTRAEPKPLPNASAPITPGVTDKEGGASIGFNLGEDWTGIQVGRRLRDGRGLVFLGLDGAFRNLDSRESSSELNQEALLEEEVRISGVRLCLGIESWTRTPSPVQIVVSAAMQASQGAVRASAVHSLTSTPSWTNGYRSEFSQTRQSMEITSREYGLAFGAGVRLPSGISSLSLQAKVESGVALRVLEASGSSSHASETRRLPPTWTVGVQWNL